MKKLFKENIVIIIIINVSFISLLPFLIIKSNNSDITTPGVTTQVDTFIDVETNYDDGDISTTSVFVHNYPTLFMKFIAERSSTLQYTQWSQSYVDYRNTIGETEVKKRGYAQKQSSVDNALLVGYTKAGESYDYTTRIYISSMLTSRSNEYDVLPGDYITKINNTDIISLTHASTLFSEIECNNNATLTIIRDEIEISRTIMKKIEDDSENCVFGLTITQQVEVDEDSITIPYKYTKTSTSGSSGGLLQALSVYNQLTATDITKGLKVAGTGTININAEVGIIGGIEQKVYTAYYNKVDVFFVPEANYDDAIKANNNLPGKGLNIVKVTTFDEALNYLENM